MNVIFDFARDVLQETHLKERIIKRLNLELDELEAVYDEKDIQGAFGALEDLFLTLDLPDDIQRSLREKLNDLKREIGLQFKRAMKKGQVDGFITGLLFAATAIIAYLLSQANIEDSK